MKFLCIILIIISNNYFNSNCNNSASLQADTKSAEDVYDSLSKYSIDLVELAAAGKLDPG